MNVECLRSAPASREIAAPEIGAHTLLAIDTALGTSVALGSGGRVWERSSDDPLRHAEALGGMLAALFEESGVAPARVTGVVTGIGPGPFTGLRVGIAAAHAFALGRGVPLLPLQGHEAVALSTLEGASAGVRIVQDAKRRELFVTEFGGLDWAGIPQRLGEPQLVAREALVAGPGDVWPERIPAARLVQLAARRLGAGSGVGEAAAFAEDRALYLRAPDVKLPGAPKRVST